MSMTAFSNSPLGEEPLGFYEGDPYRARAEAGTPSGRGGRVRCPDRRYQPNGEMGSQPPYINRYLVLIRPTKLNVSKRRLETAGVHFKNTNFKNLSTRKNYMFSLI